MNVRTLEEAQDPTVLRKYKAFLDALKQVNTQLPAVTQEIFRFSGPLSTPVALGTMARLARYTAELNLAIQEYLVATYDYQERFDKSRGGR